MKREFTAVYQKSGKWYSAWVEEVPGVNTQGRTLAEAKANLKDALKLVLETNRNLALGRAVDVKREKLSVTLPASA